MGKRKVRWDNVVEFMMDIILILIFCWIVRSYIDIVSHNMDANPVYREGNAFIYVKD